MTMVHSFTEFFLTSMRPTIRASLACPVRVYLRKVDSSLFADQTNDIQKPTPTCIKTVLRQQASTSGFVAA